MSSRKFDTVASQRQVFFEEPADGSPGRDGSATGTVGTRPARVAALATLPYPGVPRLSGPPAGDVSGVLDVRVYTLHHKGDRRHVRQVVLVTNAGPDVVPGPVSLVLSGLRRGNKLLSRTGFTFTQPPIGSPFQDLPTGPDGALDPGASASGILVFALRRLGERIHYALRVVTGPGPR
jgi:hypothetical protein